ncbi:MAG TPA: hypothetical protein VIV40_24720 [Kofleriaceae bacterium]
MRIPTSVIVMSLVTAVPFGLGVRDTLKHKDAISSDDDFGDSLDFGSKRSARESRAELEQYEAEMRREAQEREDKAKERIAKLDQLFGAKPAQMGRLFDGIVLGAGAGSFQPEDVRLRIENASRDGMMYVTFDADGKALNGVDVKLTSDYESGDLCEKLDDKLSAAWGKSTNGAWLDAATHQRASLEQDECTLRFDQYAEPAAWVAQLPLSVVGMPAEKLADQIGGAGEYEGDDLQWHVPGIGYGKSAAKIRTYAANGKIVGFIVTVDTDFDSMLAVRDALSTKLKAQPKLVDGGDDYGSYKTYEWKRKVPVVLATNETKGFSIVVGKTTWD